MRLLHVKKVTREQIALKWGFVPVLPQYKDHAYIRCNRKGEINWDNAPVYGLDRLLIRGNTKIL